MRLLVASHVLHYDHDGALSAYTPYTTEIDLWATLFEELLIASPLRRGKPSQDCRAFRTRNLSFCVLPETGGRTIADKLRQFALLPLMCWRLARGMRQADAIHVRCPGTVGLLGCLLAPLFGKPLVAKYAGQWTGYEGEPWSFSLQRWLLASRWWKGPVLVYGQPANHPPQVVAFFNSVLSAQDVEQARQVANFRTRDRREDGRVLFVGRLSKAKNAALVLQACAKLLKDGHGLRCDVVGEGPERQSLESLAVESGIAERVLFHGGLEFEKVHQLYEQADVLVLPSETEGWPKVLAEAMAFGVPCVATDRGLNSWMLGEGRGMTVRFGDIDGFAAAIQTLLSEDSDKRRRRCEACARFGQQYTTEEVRNGLIEVIERFWEMELRETER